MLRTSSAIAALVLSLANAVAPAEMSEDGVWRDLGQWQARVAAGTAVGPLRYRKLVLDWDALEPLLLQAQARYAAAPSEHSRVYLDLPMPEGDFVRFRVEEDPIMAPGLAAKFPALHTFRGISVDDPYTTVRFDRSSLGFHAMILSTGESIFIDPQTRGDTRHYVSYYKHDYVPRDSQQFVCHVAWGAGHRAPFRRAVQRQVSQSRLRTYRLALAATGEYTAFHGGTVGSAMAAITTAMNRVNGIYERDLAVRMELVDDNDQVIYTNGATDPYTNDNAFAMLAQNQSNLDAVLGPNSYDIGHVFSTGAGGIATLAVPCTVLKAEGATGVPNPIGDPFYVDFVAHELGHQFGAEHTWNGNAGFCTPDQYNASTAMEPGSGSTIMAYAGTCNGQDLQFSADDYFHAVSLDEIFAYTTQDAGNNCPVITSTGNSVPEVNAGPDYTIPVNTPFTLCGLGSDADEEDTLTFTWEQFDTGPPGVPTAPVGNAPIFRSFAPSTDWCRTFPDASDLLAGTQTLGELLPTYARTLNFRLTVRDNRPGGGGIGEDDMQVEVVDASGPFEVLAPNGSESFIGGNQVAVSWDPAGTTGAPVNCAAVDILLAADGDLNNTFPLARGTPNDGGQAVLIPSLGTTMARVQVACSSSVFFDIGDDDFSISVSPDCALNTVLTHQTITGTQLFEDETSITADTEVVVSPTGALRLWSGGTVNLGPGFRVLTGGRFEAEVIPGLCL